MTREPTDDPTDESWMAAPDKPPTRGLNAKRKRRARTANKSARKARRK